MNAKEDATHKGVNINCVSIIHMYQASWEVWEACVHIMHTYVPGGQNVKITTSDDDNSGTVVQRKGQRAKIRKVTDGSGHCWQLRKC